jgi:gliding motility-associated-like protein
MSTNNGVSWQNIPATGALGTHTKVNDSTYTVSNITSLAMNGYKYQVSVTDAASCSSTTSVATLTVVEGPAVTHTSVPTKCSDSSDGELHFTISAGETAQEYSVTLYTGSGYSDANQPSSPAVSSLSPNFVGGSTRTLDVTGLASGQYSLILRPVGGLPGLKNYYTTYTVTAPSAIVASVSGKTMICTGSQVSLSSQVSGGTVGGTRSYLWQESNDGVTFSDINTEVTPSLTATVNNDVYYRLQTMVNGHCPTYSAAHFVTALPVPVVETLLTDSGCYAFDLTNFHAVETSGISNYSLTLHYGMPSSATDNRFLIPSNNYLLREDQKKPFKFVNRQWPIFARMSVQDLCYGVGVTTIYIKDIDLCSPIIISKFFSPDGDGINELFQIEGLQDYSSPEIFIYDRYGKLVFSGNAASVTPPNGWDGKYLGRPLPSDDYWYVIKLIETKNKIGNFSLKRKKE